MKRSTIGLLIWTIVFIIIGGGILFYGMSYNPMAWANGLVTFTEPNDEPIPWGLLVIGYMFFGVIGTGVSTYNSLYEVFNKNHKDKNPFKSISLRNEWLALAVLIPGWIMVFASTYKPGYAVYIYTSFRATSRIAWNGVLYLLVGLGIIISIILLIYEERMRQNKSSFASKVATAAIFAAGYAILAEVILDANLGSVFGYLSTWVQEFGPFMSLLFVILSFYGGIAMISFITPIYNVFKKPAGEAAKADPHSEMYKILARDGVLATIAVGFLMLWWMWLTATNQETWPWANLLLFGPYNKIFWVGVVLVGIIIPLVLYGIAYNKPYGGSLITASIFSLLGMFTIISLADLIPQSITWYYTISPISPAGSNWVYELRSIFNNGPLWSFLSFKIPFYDTVWFLGSALFLLGVYTLGVLILPLEEDEKAKHWIFK